MGRVVGRLSIKGTRRIARRVGYRKNPATLAQDITDEVLKTWLDKFFDLLEASAEQARTSIQTLVKHLQNPSELKALDEFIVSRRKEKAINAEISVKTFFIVLTPPSR